jgi:hypothetical protein
MSMKKYFEDFDFTNFWDDDEYALDKYVEDKPTDELIKSIEDELGFKLPVSYIELMKVHNGGTPFNNCFPVGDDYKQISGISGIGRIKTYSLCGSLGSQFMIDEWGYPNTGICICDTPSAGHDMIMLDYSKHGKNGEPEVIHVDQESDYEVTFLAKDFETFIRGLVNESVYDTSAEDLAAALYKVEHGKFSTVLTDLCNNFIQFNEIEKVIRSISKEVVTQKGHFSLHADELSYLLYDIQFWLYSSSKSVRNKEQFLTAYESIMTLPTDGVFSMNGYAPGFVQDWLADRLKNGAINSGLFKLKLSATHKQKLIHKLNDYL